MLFLFIFMFHVSFVLFFNCCWLAGSLARWLAGWIADWPTCWLAWWLACWFDCWLAGFRAGPLAGLLAGSLASVLVGWVAGLLAGFEGSAGKPASQEFALQVWGCRIKQAVRLSVLAFEIIHVCCDGGIGKLFVMKLASTGVAATITRSGAS